MITILGNNGDENGVTSVVLTLYEKCQLDSPYFTWRIKNDASREEIIFTPNDISLYPELWNQFVITVSEEDPIPTLGRIQAQPGEYHYTIYESSLKDQMDLDECFGIIEEGILKIVGTSNPITTFTPLNDTIKIFQP